MTDMKIFTVTLSNVLLTLFYIIPGYLACKAKKACADHLSTMSAILVYVCSPCMLLSSFLALDFSVSDLKSMGLFFVFSLFSQLCFMAVLYLIFRKKHGDSRYRIFNVASVLGNVGFFGLPVIRAVLPEYPVVMCYSGIYCVTMNLLVFSMGVYCLTGKKEYMTFRAAICNPTTFAFFVALPLYIFGVKAYLPQTLIGGLNLLGNMTTPLCMLILGIRLATVSLKKILTRPLVYAISFSKMVVYPLFCYALVYFLPLSFPFKASMLILSSVPCASVILNLAELHRSETELAANCVLVSTLMCFLTIPVLTLLL